MGETYCNVQLSVLRLASTQCFLAGKGRLTITLMGWPPILLPAQKLSSHSEAAATGLLLLDHLKPVGNFCFYILLTVIKSWMVPTTNNTLVGIKLSLLAASPTSATNSLVLVVLAGPWLALLAISPPLLLLLLPLGPILLLVVHLPLLLLVLAA